MLVDFSANLGQHFIAHYVYEPLNKFVTGLLLACLIGNACAIFINL